MAAPVHEQGVVVGALVVASSEPGRTYTRSEQDVLHTLAEHASLALTDAKTVGTMLHQALHDSLTGLPNRALFLDRLGHALQRGGGAARVGVLFCDLDRFKTVNDSLGHAAGDELLVAVAARLGGCLRTGDTAARLGRSEEHTSELQSRQYLVCRLLLEKKKNNFTLYSVMLCIVPLTLKT